MMTTCPKGHSSTDHDYCSECGSRIDGASGAVPGDRAADLSGPPRQPTGTGEACPDCGMERQQNVRFCETCRYDFVKKAPGPAPVAAAPAPVTAAPPVLAGSPTEPPAPVDPAPGPIPAPSPNGARFWEAVVAVDPTLDPDPDPTAPCPQNEPERTFPLDLPESLIGRRDDRRDIHPEVALRDPGVSRRHAMVYRDIDGSLALVDLDSANGTQLHGARVEPGVKTPLADGDQIVIGRWTRITFRARD